MSHPSDLIVVSDASPIVATQATIVVIKSGAEAPLFAMPAEYALIVEVPEVIGYSMSDQGPPGIKGDKGDPGIGTKGDKGDQGLPGVGMPGKDGKDGKDGISEEDMTYSKRIDFADDTTIYRGDAAVGTADAQPLWRIRRITLAGDGDVTEEWAGGTAAFDKSWDSRATLGYI